MYTIMINGQKSLGVLCFVSLRYIQQDVHHHHLIVYFAQIHANIVPEMTTRYGTVHNLMN